jgi:transposase
MSKVIDLPRIQTALNRLDQIAADHPETCGSGAAWTEKEIEQMIRRKGGTPVKERAAAYRQRLAERGYKREVFFVSPACQAALMTLREESPHKTRDQILEDALTAKLAALTITNQTAIADPSEVIPMPTPTLTRVERDRAIVELHRQGLNNRAVGRQLGCSEATVRRALKEQV